MASTIFGWFTHVRVDGVDRLPELRRHVARFGLLTEDAAQRIRSMPIRRG